MKKKYIIDLNPDCVEGEYLRIPARIAGEEQWLVTKAALTPYTEPDLELIKQKAHDNGYSEGYQDGYCKGMNDYLQKPEVKEESDRACAHGYSDAESKFSEIRKEAYEKGYETGYEDGYNEPGKNQEEVYQRGLADAWAAARKICTNWVLPDSVLSKIFGIDKTIDDIMKENTASECIEKIRQYEQEKQEKDAEIKVGKEFHMGERKCVVTHIIDGTQRRVLWDNGVSGLVDNTDLFVNLTPTGRYFPEVAAVLEKMREGQDG